MKIPLKVITIVSMILSDIMSGVRAIFTIQMENLMICVFRIHYHGIITEL